MKGGLLHFGLNVCPELGSSKANICIFYLLRIFIFFMQAPPFQKFIAFMKGSFPSYAYVLLF